jgi:hypothetical protein
MSKTEFWILNVVGGICALVIAAGLILSLLNQRLNQEVMITSNRFGQAQQLQQTARNLVLRIAQDGQKDDSLRLLLARHQINVNVNAPDVNTDASRKATP